MSISNVTQKTITVTAGQNALELAPPTSTPPEAQNTPPVPRTLTKPVNQLQADQQNLFNLVDQLKLMSTQNDGKPLTPDQISSALKSQIDTPFVGSTYALTRSTPPTLATVITDLGYEMPVTADQVAALAKQIEQKASIPVLGNLGGGLSWPIPMSKEERKSIRSFLLSGKSGLPGLPLRATYTNGTLNYLLQGSSVTHSDLQGDPQAALQKLFDTPRAQALGQALQTHLKGVSTATSIYDYLLTAINDGLDLSGLFYPEPKKIGDIYLDSPVYWGQPPSLVAEHLSKYLIKEGLASESTAKLATHVLLANRAPHFLIKDVPANVKVGSVLWGQLAIAAAKIEAQTPGLLPGMTYAEVIAYAESIPANTVDVQVAQRENLKEWGLANGLLPILQTAWTPIDGVLVPSTPEPTESQMEQVRVAYNSRLQALAQTSTGLYTPLASRKEIALDCLRTEFPDLDPAVFEAQVLAKQYTGRARAGDPRLRSMLDIVMEGEKLGETYKWITNDRRVPIDAFNAFARTDKLDAPEVFKAQFEPSIKAQKEGHYGMVKHLISQMPLADRKNFEFGKLEYFYSNDYKSTPGNPLELVKRGHTLIVKTTRNGEANLYEIDTTKGTIEKQNDRLATLLDQRETTNEKSEKIVSKVRSYHPFNDSPAPNSAESTETPAIPDSYNSDRTNNIADFYVNSLGLDDESFLNYCKGVTSFDKDHLGDKAIGNFLLNLIPFRAAIVNLSNGRYGEAVGDLAFDIFGFVTLGAGKVAQASKALGRGLGVTHKASKVIKFLGASTLEALNPLPTTLVGNLLTGGGKLLAKGATKSVELANRLRGASGSYDLLKAASKSQGVVAIGTFKVAEQSIDGSAVFRDGKWYNYDPATNRPYGPALKGFTPSVAALEGEIKLSFTETWLGKMIGAVVAPPATNPNFRRDFVAAIAKAKLDDRTSYIRGQNTGRPDSIFGYSTALSIDDLKRLAVAERRTPEALGSLVKRIDELEVLPERFNAARDAAKITDPDAYKRGYSAGAPENITGFSGALTNNQLAELVIARGRSAEEIGQLVKYMENRRVNISLENFKVFSEEVTAAGGKVTALPQGFYLSQVSLLSEGECAALSNLMAAAIKQGKQDTLLENLFTAMVPTLSPAEIAILEKTSPTLAAIEVARAKKAPAVAQFRKELNRLQGALGNQFHLGMASRQVPYTALISELANARSSKTLLINGPGHGITAGVVVSNGKKEWFYFDPNFGKATFDNEAAMRAGLESTLNSGRTKNLLAHYGDNASVPEYKISVFDRADLNDITKSLKIDPSDFFLKPL
ncbi:hypothetical protein [Pseudomonas sp. Xaverov 259]|uniref:hypothetical protein n=1 Tax=Pseudomonas sp. Xaverov 259 TaxID=2666086 RepID=UPI001C5BF6D1|nr:hypothetical protein [Pseudomonas sp. Xaverov 259]